MKQADGKVYEQYRSTAIKGDADPLSARRLRYSIGELLPSNLHAEIVDIGAGAGELIGALREWGYQSVSGIDFSQEQVVAAESAGVQGIICGDALQWLENKSDCFDVIIAFDFLEHLSRDQTLRFLELAHSALRPKGIIILRSPNSLVLPGYRYCDYSHYQAFTSHSIAQVLRICHFTDIGVRECPPEPVSILGIGRFCVWQVIRLFIATYFLVATGSSMGMIYSPNLLVFAKK